MDERRERRGRDDRDVKPVESVFRQLFESIEKDATSKVVKAQAQLIQRLRMKAPVHQTNPVLDRAEKQLFQLVKDRGDPSDITLQSEKVQSLRANPTPSKSLPRLVSGRFTNSPFSSSSRSRKRRP